MTNDTAIIHAFIQAWGQQDLEGVLRFFAPDAIFIASTGPEPGRTHQGRTAIRSAVSAMFATPQPASAISTKIWSSGTEHFVTWASRDPAVPAAGLTGKGIDHFTIIDGKITLKDAYTLSSS
jgi:ketosteroid isomerase-like protein